MKIRLFCLEAVRRCVLSCAIVLSVTTSAWSQALPLMLAGRYDGNIDPAAYWVSEKLDGVRAHWDGRRLLFRSGRPISAPAWFVEGLPPVALDGELWIGRGRFEELVGIVREQVPDDAGWRKLRFMVFDLPRHEGSFTERIVAMQALVTQAGLPWVRSVEQLRVPDRRALVLLFDAVVAGGGEGLMLHRADARHVAGRSDALLKYVPWLDDEARVVAHLPGKGKFAGMLGSLLVERPDGRRFRLGSGFSDAQRRQPPALGVLVTYRYRELTGNGLPRFPVFLRVRELP